MIRPLRCAAVLFLATVLHAHPAPADATRRAGPAAPGAEPPTLRFITQNLDFALSADKWNADIDALTDHAEVVFLQEAKDANVQQLIDQGWSVHQDTSSQDRAGSAVTWRLDRATAADGGLTLGVKPDGQKMLTRWIAWNDLLIDGQRKIRVVSVHLPPERYRSLYPEYARHLAEFAGQSPYPLVIGGDWNWQTANDPGGLAEKTGMRFVGYGIDGFLVDRRLTIGRTWQEPKRHSDHHGVGMAIAEPPGGILSAAPPGAPPRTAVRNDGTTATPKTPAAPAAASPPRPLERPIPAAGPGPLLPPGVWVASDGDHLGYAEAALNNGRLSDALEVLERLASSAYSPTIRARAGERLHVTGP